VQERLLKMLIEIALKRLSEGQLQEWADMALDYLEDKIQESETQVDDMIALPLLQLIRATFNIEDGDN